MAPLQDLELDYPIIDSHFRMFCAHHGIFTDNDFLVHDLSALVAFAGQDYAAEKLKQGIKQIICIIENQQRPWLNGQELLEDAQLNKCTLSTGCERIDHLLQGGLREGHVTELVGPSCSGKTQVCLKTASHVARNYLGKVIYFDSGNSFSPKRVAQFLSLSSGSGFSTTEELEVFPAWLYTLFKFDDTLNLANVYALHEYVLLHKLKKEVNRTVQRVMNSIVCHSVFDIFTLLDMLRQLMHNLKSQTDYKVRMLVIDSLSSLIAPVLGGGGAHGHALMVTTGFLLKEIAHEYNLCVVVTNHMVAGEAGTSKPALGESWKSIPHVRLLLSRKYSTNGNCITILKHPFLGTGKSTDFGNVI